MNKENEEKLMERFSFLRPTGDIRHGLMVFGFECGDGWFDLLWKLCEDIEKEVKASELEHEFRAVQVKEKFGTLRFYVNFGTDKIHDLINEAEQKSYTICEVCGKPATVETAGWITYLCDEHAKGGDIQRRL